MRATRASIDRKIDALTERTAGLTHEAERRALTAGSVVAAALLFVWWGRRLSRKRAHRKSAALRRQHRRRQYAPFDEDVWGIEEFSPATAYE
jgi:hypothetical protein